jgi:hypothetical protein
MAGLDKTRLTVAVETPASLATSLIFVRICRMTPPYAAGWAISIRYARKNGIANDFIPSLMSM